VEENYHSAMPILYPTFNSFLFPLIEENVSSNTLKNYGGLNHMKP